MTTDDKVRAVQAHVGVVADGIIGPLTLKAICRDLGITTTSSSKTTLTKKIQQALNLAVDGIFGNATLNAVFAKLVHTPDADEESVELPEVPFKDIDPNDAVDQRVFEKCKATLFMFETGTKEGDYSNVSIYKDGGGGAYRQITYGAAQTTQDGNLDSLLEMYIASVKKFETNDTLASKLAKYLPTKKKRTLVDNKTFITLLKDLGKDAIMRYCQDLFFQDTYFLPAYKWFINQGFKQPLSMLVIYDSFIHSGCILSFLRKRFSESVPANGGDEKKWVQDYVNTRRSWLANHSNKILRKTVYRMDTMQRAINDDNWDLTKPIYANGETIV
jgi:chitosanase